jgi:lipopolysaccharide/colanic/teichoic acid biosynthesis glycosyltransferase
MGSGLTYEAAKRLFDVTVAAFALVALSPVLLLIAALVRVAIGSPVLFRQTRPGRGGEPFELLKFRTMTDARGADGALLPDRQRLTRVGRALRAASLDELPELVNVLRGEMSLVGPRPLLMQYLDLYSPEQARRHEVRPGITGWAQVNGRNATTWDARLANDLYYVDHRSMKLDLHILKLTVKQVFRAHGIAHSDDAPMPFFTGDPTLAEPAKPRSDASTQEVHLDRGEGAAGR